MNDDLKKKWRDTNVSMPRDTVSYESITTGKRKTALDNLTRRYLWFSNLELAFLLIVPFNLMNLALFPDLKYRMLMVIWFGSFFIIAFVMDRWLYHGIKRIDVFTMSVSEVVAKALYFRKWHIRFIFILIPLALGCLGLLAYITDELAFRLGMIAGFLLGVAIGVRQLMAFLADYRSITSEK